MIVTCLTRPRPIAIRARPEAQGNLEGAYQTRLVSIGQRLDQRCFHQAENGYRSSDTQGQNECGCTGEAGVLAKLTDRVSKILGRIVDPV